MNMKEIKIETMRGKGPGGQHKNKTDSAVRATHIPTGISVSVDGRHQRKNKRLALRELRRRLERLAKQAKATRKKRMRDERIHDRTAVRTYDFKSGVVRDHRTGKVVSLKEVLGKGRIELLR